MTDGDDAPWIATPGEELCLDYANTRYWRGTASPTEELSGFADLVAWCAAKTGLPAGQAAALAAWAAAEPAAASALRTEAIELREAIYRLFHALAENSAPVPANLEWLNRALAAVAGRRAIAPTEAGFGWRVGTAAPAVLQLLTPVLWSAGDLLVGKRLAKVRHCANPDCEWLFIDDSKSGNRRWCSMSACGNRAKAHRHYARKKGRTV